MTRAGLDEYLDNISSSVYLKLYSDVGGKLGKKLGNLGNMLRELAFYSLALANA
jgi:hypothetical protein